MEKRQKEWTALPKLEAQGARRWVEAGERHQTAERGLLQLRRRSILVPRSMLHIVAVAGLAIA